jgi:Rieske Fe-S protein
MTDHITPTRRQVLLTSGTVVAAAAVTAACGSSDSGSGSGSGSGSSESAAPATVEVADLAVGGGAILLDQKVVVTEPEKGVYKAFTAVCTHQGCVVSDIADGKITCACHGSAFSAVDGSVITGPAKAPLAELKTTVSGGTITVS